MDIARGWGRRQSVARDYIFDSPVLLGSSRIGPDLANVGTRLDASSLHKHLYRPPHGSNMPAYSYLYKVREIRGASSSKAIHFEEGEFGAPEDGFEVVPKPEAEYLVSYLLNLKQDYELPESKFYPEEEHSAHHVSEKTTANDAAGSSVDPKVLAKGKKLFNTPGACVTCHQANGQGLVAANFPPLIGSEWVTGSEEVVVRIVLNGLQGPITVAGKEYGLVPMVPTIWISWTDEQIAAVITYIRNSWGNHASLVTPKTVKRIRKEVGTRGPWTIKELEAYR